MFFQLYKLLKDKPHNKNLLQVLIVINILGSIYGFYWYRFQLAATQLKFWLFVPDSPLSTTLLALALIILLKRKKENWLNCLAYLAVIKYGLWAVIVISHYWFVLGEVNFTEIVLWFSHWGMALEGLVYFRHFKVTKSNLFLVITWFFIWDYVDYRLNLHPYLYLPSQGDVALFAAVFLSLILIIWSIGKINLIMDKMEKNIS